MIVTTCVDMLAKGFTGEFVNTNWKTCYFKV